MGRGRDKIILGSDFKNMSPGEANAAIAKAVRISGTAVVRGKDGNARYDEPKRAGQYGERNIGK